MESSIPHRDNSRVQVFTKDGKYLYHFTVPNQPNFKLHSTVTHHGLFYSSDFKNGVIHVIQIKNGLTTRVGTIGEKGHAFGQLQKPYGLEIDKDHHLLVCDNQTHFVSKFTLDGQFIGKTSNLNRLLTHIAIQSDGQSFFCTCDNGSDCDNVVMFSNVTM